jgi:hypothetical protein
MMNILKVLFFSIFREEIQNKPFDMTMPPMGSLNYLQRKKQIEKINTDNMVFPAV